MKPTRKRMFGDIDFSRLVGSGLWVPGTRDFRALNTFPGDAPEEPEPPPPGGGILAGTALYELPFDDGSGQSCQDLSGVLSAYLGTDSESVDAADPTWASHGLTLANGDHVQLADNGVGLFDKQTFTLGILVNITTLQASTGLFNYDNTAHSAPYYATSLRADSGTIIWEWNNAGSYSAASLIQVGSIFTTNVWKHVVLKMTAGEQKIKVNDSVVGSKTATHTITYYTSPARIGKTNFSSNSAYKLGYFYFYDSYLSDADDTTNHSALQTLMTARGESLP